MLPRSVSSLVDSEMLLLVSFIVCRISGREYHVIRVIYSYYDSFFSEDWDLQV